MRIIKNENGEFILCYKYKIITNRSKTDKNIYYFYTSHFPNEIVEYLGTNEYWIYGKDNDIYLTTEKPAEYPCKKLVARDKYKNSTLKVIPLNPKFFNLIGDVKDKFVKILIHLNKEDFVSDDVLIKFEIEKEDISFEN